MSATMHSVGEPTHAANGAGSRSPRAEVTFGRVRTHRARPKPAMGPRYSTDWAAFCNSLKGHALTVLGATNGALKTGGFLGRNISANHTERSVGGRATNWWPKPIQLLTRRDWPAAHLFQGREPGFESKGGAPLPWKRCPPHSPLGWR